MGSLDPDVDMKQELDDSGYVQDDTGSKIAMEECRGSANLLDLSDDVLLYILKNLSAHELKALGYTCSRLGTLVLDHTLWVDVDGRDVPHGSKRVRWMLTRVLGPHTRRLRLTGYAAQATGCLGFVTRNEREDGEEDAPAEEERWENIYPCWENAVTAAGPPSQRPSTGRPIQYAIRPAPAQPVAGPSQASTSSAGPSNSFVSALHPSASGPSIQPSASGPSTRPSASTSQPCEPGTSQQTSSQPKPSSAGPLPSRAGSSEVLAAGSLSWQVTSVSQPSTSDTKTSGPQASTSGQHVSTSESTQATPSQSNLAEPSTSASGSQPSMSGLPPSTLASASGPQSSAYGPQALVHEPEASASGRQLRTAGVSAAQFCRWQSPLQPAGALQASRNRGGACISSPRLYSTSNTTCPGPQLTFTHMGLRALCVLCPNLTALELDHCVIDCQTMNIGQFPKTLLRLSLRGTKCFNMEAKTFIFKIHDHLANLEDIDVSFCSWIEPACVLPLSKMSNLLRLSMRECQKLAEFVAYASLATRYGFKKLKVLDLRGSPVGDSEVSALGWLPALEELYLSPWPKTEQVPEHAHYKQDPLPEFKELDDWEETDPECFRTCQALEAEWIREEESAQGVRNRFFNCEEPSADAYRNYLARRNAHAPADNSLLIGSRQERLRKAARRILTRREADELPGQEQDVTLQNRGHASFNQQPGQGRDTTPQTRKRRNSDQRPGPSGEADKPGTSGQKRKSDKKNDSSSDDDYSPTKVAGTTRTTATQTGMGSCPMLNRKGSKKTKTACTTRCLYETSLNETINKISFLRSINEPAANNNNRQDNNRGLAGPNVEQPMDVDLRLTNNNQNPMNDDAVAGPSNTESNPMKSSKYPRSMHKLLRIAHRAAQDRANAEARNQAESAQVEAENIAEAEIPKQENQENETEKATDEAEQGNKKPMDVDVNRRNNCLKHNNEYRDVNCNHDRNNTICLYRISNRNIIYYRPPIVLDPENGPEAGNQAESARINDNNQATEYEKLKAANEAEKAANEEDGNKKTKDVGSQTSNQYNGVPGRDGAPLTPEQLERNRNLYENRAHNVVTDRLFNLPNMEQDLNSTFHNAARVVLDAYAQADSSQRPGGPERQRFYQFGQNLRQIVIKECVNNDCNEPRNQRAMPRGVIFAGLIPARLDHSSLVSDSSIRRFGRAVGENILYIGGGAAAHSIARPDRSNLRILSVTGFRYVTDSSLTHLASAAPQLHTLDVTGTGVSARASRAFRTMRPDVKLITNLPEDDLEMD